jgi:hypothetical protein
MTKHPLARLDSSSLRKLISAAIGLVVLCIIVLAGVPPVDRDALTHHLAVPKLYLHHGGIYEIPEVPFSYYPMNLDLLYLAALYIENDILPKYIHFAFALLTSVLLYRYLRKNLYSAAYALLGCLLFLSLPVIVKLSVTVYVDLGLVYFSTAALLQVFRWAESGFRVRYLLIAGVFAGLCLGTKYNGILGVFLLGLFVLILPLRVTQKSSDTDCPPRIADQNQKTLRVLGSAALFCAIALAVYSPWMIRNYIWTGNPFYPMAGNIFQSKSPQAAEDQPDAGATASDTSSAENDSSGLHHFMVRTVVFGEGLWDILSIPIRVFFQGEDDDPKYFDGRLNPYLLLFPLAALGLAKRSRRSTGQILEQRLMAGFAALYLILSFLLTDMRIRYIAPIIPPLVLLAVYGIRDLNVLFQESSCKLKRPGVIVVHFVLAVLLGMNGFYIMNMFKRVEPFSYLAGKISRDDYILSRRPEYHVTRYANRHLPDDARILCLFTGNRIYYSDRAMVCDTEFFRRAIRSRQSPEAVAGQFADSGVSHLLIGSDIFHRWAESQFDENGRSLLRALFDRHFKGVYHSHGYYLFEIVKR